MTSAGNRLEALAKLGAELMKCAELDEQISVALAGLNRDFGYEHIILFVPADDAAHLVVLAYHGYPGGVGAVVPLGEGTIGVAAERRRAVRINNVMQRVMLAQVLQPASVPLAQIPFPGIPNVQSQIAVPAFAEDKLVAVLYAEDQRVGRFLPDDVHVLSAVGNLLAFAIRHGQRDEEGEELPAEPPAPKSPGMLTARYYDSDGSVFFDDEYVIKSLPGRILFRLLKSQKETGRQEFTTKELRLDESLKLPPVRDNLDTRLILLRRRLAERFPFVEIVPAGRGRFRLRVDRPFELVVATANYP